MKTQAKTLIGVGGNIPARELSKDLAAIFQNLQLIAFGIPAAGTKTENLDGVWVVHEFGTAANADETVPHELGRKPVGLIEVQLPPDASGTVPATGVVTFGTKLPTDLLVTLRCTSASKRAAVILF